jgi:hypothetical protein
LDDKVIFRIVPLKMAISGLSPRSPSMTFECRGMASLEI